MRYSIAEAATLKVFSPIGVFATSDTVTITVYKDGVLEVLTSDVCVEIGTTGIFYWQFSDLDTAPTEFSQYFWVMVDTTTKKTSGDLVFGDIVSADTCKITTNLYEADGSCRLEPNDLFDPNKKNYINLKTTYYANNRYYKLDKYRPSYDASTGQAFWIMPRSAVVDIKIESIGLDETSVTVPNLSTVDLYTLINT